MILFLSFTIFSCAKKSSDDSSSTSAIDTNTWYRLTNKYISTEKALDTYADTHVPFMSATAGDYSGQYWEFTAIETITN